MITVSEAALKKLKELLAEHGGVGISVSVFSSGCSGVDYSLAYEPEEDPKRAKVEIDGLKFFYDPSFESLMDGLSIELVENSFGHGFVATNKNYTGCQNCTCNCHR
ncbi:MAG: iron-sulfur cluster assembly accessory protein [Alphaproteobacteria bacterium]|nr:iron-sulfur cluster assembly accessory protein [Alphaproteobacteria bacterium]